MKKKLLFGIFLSLLVLSSVAFACSTQTPTSTQPTSTQPTSTTKTTTTAPKVIELKYSTWGAPGSAVDQITQQHFDRIEELSGGRLKITRYYGGSLLAYADQYRGLQTGVADLGPYVVGTMPGIHQLNLFVQLPAMGFTSMQQGNAIYKELWNKYPELEQELEGLVVLDHKFQPGLQLHMVKSNVIVPEDLRGKKITGTMILAEDLRGINCEMVSLGPTDWFMSLERGLVEGAISHWPAAQAFKTTELMKYHTELGSGGMGMGMGFNVMNKKTWDSLSPDLQQLFIDSQEQFELDVMAIDTSYCEAEKQKAKDLGHTVNEQLTAEEMQLWTNLFLPSHQRWIEATEAKGLPGQALYDDLVRLIQEIQVD
ncbi:MAG: TRAP transporter substrate-binding protein DctP [Dehalococcoidales bacterium]|nr:TRAP transporter substrate-binding protein DctP [Dehalococcoidales bacterium]